MTRSFFALLFLFALAGSASALSYYADISLDVEASGAISISGVSNHPLMQNGRTEALTSKKGGYWLLNLTLPREDVFSDYVYAVYLPPGASINYVRAESFRISSSGDRIKVSGSGRNTSMSVVIQYQMPGYPAGTDYSVYLYAGVVVLAFVFILAIYMQIKKKKSHVSNIVKEPVAKEPGLQPCGEQEAPAKTISANYSKYAGILTDRQKDILRILSESGKPVNQAAVCERLNLPKSSVSRNVSGLADLGVIEKKRVGMSMFLSLKKE